MHFVCIVSRLLPCIWWLISSNVEHPTQTHTYPFYSFKYNDTHTYIWFIENIAHIYYISAISTHSRVIHHPHFIRIKRPLCGLFAIFFFSNISKSRECWAFCCVNKLWFQFGRIRVSDVIIIYMSMWLMGMLLLCLEMSPMFLPRKKAS